MHKENNEMAPWRTAICKTNGVEIFYTRTGGNKPPLVLLHGLMTNGACWTPLARALDQEYDVIMPDARGHGMSTVPDYGYQYDDHASDIIGLISSLLPSPPVLLGHSMGGMTAAVVANRQPDLLRGLILIDPTFLSPKVQREVRDSNVAEGHRRVLAKPFEEVLADAQTRHPDRPLELLKLLAQARLQTSMAAFDILTPPNPDFKRLASGLAVPTVLISSDKGVISKEVAEELHCLNPKVQLKQIYGAGHAIQFDQPERCIDAVKSFLCLIEKPGAKFVSTI